MPRPIFDVEQYELRGLTPEVYTDSQKKALNETLARVNGQVDWTAQLLGFNGPKYWGRPSPKADGTYNWTGLVETMGEKRQMQVGAYGVFNKDLPYEQWPAPFNRTKIGASGDIGLHIFERDDQTIVSPMGQGEGIDYMHELAIFAGGSYVFDCELEIEYRLIDPNQHVTVKTFIENENTWTRLTINSQALGGTILIREKDSEAMPCPLELIHWEDISDWTSESTQDQFIGLWGNKGAAVSFDFSFDALDLHGNDEIHSLALTTGVYTLTVSELMAKVGWKDSFWTGVDASKFSFKVGDCPTPFPVVPPYINEPYQGWPWEPIYTEDGLEFMRCEENCNYTIVGRQYLSDVDDHDNGEYESFCSNSGYFPDGFSDCVEQIIPVQPSDDNGTLEDVLPPIGRIDEGEYDRIPWRKLDHFEFELIPKTDCPGLDLPCFEWVVDPLLDNGRDDQFIPSPYYQIDNDITNPPEAIAFIAEFIPGGPGATVDEGIYDKFGQSYLDYLPGSDSAGCVDGEWLGYDDGIYDEQVEPYCDEDPHTLYYDGGLYKTPLVLPDYSACDCTNLACWADNLVYGENPYGPGPVYQGPEKADMGVYVSIELPLCTYVDGGVGPLVDYDAPDCDASVMCCDVDNSLYGGMGELICNKVDGKIYSLENGRPADEPIPPIPFQDKCPEYDLCPYDMLYINMSEVFELMSQSLRPSMHNALTPLRLWKDRVLTNIDEIPNEDLTDHNFLVADANNGSTPEDSYRHFVRLPIEYERNGKEWNRSAAVCDNMSYFSTPSKISPTLDEPRTIKPALYSEVYRDAVKDYEIFYDEDFIYSVITSDTENVQPGFEDSGVFKEEEVELPFKRAVTTFYDPIESRIPYENGEWKGDYYVLGVNGNRTGHISTDVASYALVDRIVPEEYPVFDFSIIKMPNVQFPSDSGLSPMRDYSVSYAYFAADYSAADDPVFDPNKPQCWRRTVIDCLQKTPDNEDCEVFQLETQTQYILHPVN